MTAEGEAVEDEKEPDPSSILLPDDQQQKQITAVFQQLKEMQQRLTLQDSEMSNAHYRLNLSEKLREENKV